MKNYWPGWRERIPKATDWAIVHGLVAVFLADWWLAPPGISLPFAYLTILPFTIKADQLKPLSYRLGLTCAILTIGGAALKLPPPEMVPLVVANRCFALLAIGSVTYMVDSTIKSAAATAALERRLDELERKMGA